MTKETGHAVLLEQAMKAMATGKHVEADKLFNGALNMAPGQVDCLFSYGTFLSTRGCYGAALALLLSALEQGGRQHEIYNNIGNALRGLGKDGEAEKAWTETLRIMKTHGIENPDVYNNMGTVRINAARAAEAEDWCRQALALRPDSPQAHWNLSLALLEQGRFREGWDEFGWGYRSGGRLNKQYDCGVWDGSHVKRLVLFGEQGQGDEILFASMIPDAAARCDELILDCHPRLEAIFKRSFDPLAIYPTRKDPGTAWIYDHYPITAKMAMGDLGGVLRRELTDFPAYRKEGYQPYLTTNPAFDHALKQRSDKEAKGKLKIGIAWAGGTLKTHAYHRGVDFLHFKTLIEVFEDRAEFFSVHYKKDSEAYLKKQGVKVHHWQEIIDNLDALFSLAGAMDLIITADQTIVHQAGAIGAECWVLCPHKCSWRFPPQAGDVDLPASMPWYGENVRLFRQDVNCDWTPVFERVHEALTDRLGAKEDGEITISKSGMRDGAGSPRVAEHADHGGVLQGSD